MAKTKYRSAKKRLSKKREFYRHLRTYLAFSIFFFVLNALTDFGDWWFYWPVLGWGLAVLIQGLSVVGPFARWEEDQMDREIRRLGSSQGEDETEQLELRQLSGSEKDWKEEDLV